MSEEKEFDVDAFIEYHIGDCSCEHGHECQSCTMKRELKDEIKSLESRLKEAEIKPFGDADKPPALRMQGIVRWIRSGDSCSMAF